MSEATTTPRDPAWRTLLQETTTPRQVGDAPQVSSLRPITDSQAYNAAISSIQTEVRSRYGYSMPHEQAAGIARRDPNANTRIRMELPTLAFQDQDFRHRVEESGLTGIWRTTNAAGEEERTTTIAGRTAGLAETETFGYGLGPEVTPESLGFFDTPYLDDEGNIVSVAGFNARKAAIRAIASARLGFELTDAEADRLAHGSPVQPVAPTLGGRELEGSIAAITGDYRGSDILDKYKFDATLEHDITMDELQQEHAIELATGWTYTDPYTGHTSWMMGTQGLAAWRLNLETQLQEQGLEDADARFYAGLEQDRLLYTGYYEVVYEVDANGNRVPVDNDRDGKPDRRWIYGQSGLELRAQDLQESLAQLGIDADRGLEILRQDHERILLAGFDQVLPNGDVVHVYGSQEWELIGEAQRTEGFDASIVVGENEDGTPHYEVVHFQGTAELAFGLEEKQRVGYWTTDRNGRPIYVPGTEDHEEHMQSLADSANLTLVRVHAYYQDEMQHAQYLYDIALKDMDIDVEEQARTWQVFRDAADQDFEREMLDLRLDAEERIARRESRQASETMFWQAVSALGATALTLMVQHYWPSGQTPGFASYEAAIASRAQWGEASHWKTNYPELTDDQAEGLAARFKVAPAPVDPVVGDGAGAGDAGDAGDAGAGAGDALAGAGAGAGAGDVGAGDAQPTGDLSIAEYTTPGTSELGIYMVDEEGVVWYQDEGGAMHEAAGMHVDAEGDLYTVSADGTHVYDAGATGIEWDRLRDTLTPRNVISAGLAFVGGFMSAEGLMYGDFAREHSELANGWEFGKMASMFATGNFAALGAYMAGRTAAVAWEFHSGGREDYWDSIGVDLGMNLHPSWLPEALGTAADGGARYDAFINYQTQEVVYSEPGGGVVRESLEDFVNRTHILPISLRGQEQETYDAMPTELQEQIGFAPRYVLIFEDSVRFYEDSPGLNSSRRSSVLIDRDDPALQQWLGGEGDGGDGDGLTDTGGDPDAELFSTAVEMGGLDEDELSSISDNITDPSRRRRFLRRLANSEGFSEAEIDLIFDMDPDTRTYNDLAAWQVFHGFAEAGRIHLIT